MPIKSTRVSVGAGVGVNVGSTVGNAVGEGVGVNVGVAVAGTAVIVGAGPDVGATAEGESERPRQALDNIITTRKEIATNCRDNNFILRLHLNTTIDFGSLKDFQSLGHVILVQKPLFVI